MIDNGSEFTSRIMDLWAYHNRVQIDFSRPGKPTDNAHVESESSSGLSFSIPKPQETSNMF